MSNTVKDRSGQGLPPKAERRALGKAAARKRQQQRHRRQILGRVAQVAAPIAVVAVIVGAIWLFGGGKADKTPLASTPDSSATGAADPGAQPTTPDYPIPAGLETKPVVGAGGSDPVTDLKVTTLVPGSGAPLTAGQSVTVNYVGVSYGTGEEFDASWNRGQPFTFTLGVGGVIPGWDQGLVGVTIGSRVQLDIPVALAYDNQPGYPAGDLRFVVDVLGAQ